MEDERWLPIKGYEQEYMISDYGRIKSLKQKEKRILKSCITGFGYSQVTLYKYGYESRKKYKVHRLVALHFCNKNNNKFNEVDHLDFNKTNNYYKNLEWTDRKGNMAFRKGKPCGKWHTKKYIYKINSRYVLNIYFLNFYKQFTSLNDAITKRGELLNEYLRENTSCK